MELVFLGNGGGRIILDRQILPTGGFRINSQKFSMHVDPGPGALLKSFEHKQDPVGLDAIFVSHSHIDHCNDANMMIEAMNFGNYHGKKGILLGSESVINGHQNFEKQIDEYFKGMLKECRPLKAGDIYKFSENISLKAMKTLHEDPTDIGFLLEIDGIKIGYTSDTQYFPGIAAQFEGVNFLIINCLRPNNDKLEFHMCTSEAVKIVNEMIKKPKLVILTHLGMKFLQAGPESQSRKVQDETGVHTILAKDGLKINLKEYSDQKRLI